MRRYLLILLVAFLAALAMPAAASAEGAPNAQLMELVAASDAAAILTELDKRHNPFDDQELKIAMTTRGGPTDGNTLEFTVLSKGDGTNRAIRFNKPADTKGMKLVIKGSDEIYIKLPGAAKVRRVGTHSRKQSFQGTTWNFDDMALIRYEPYYTPGEMKDNGSHVTMNLKLKDGMEIAYSRLIIHINKEYFMIDKIEYFEGEEKVKLQERSMPRKLSEYSVFSKQVMRDLKTNVATESELLEEKINQGIPDSTFSRRWLVRGN